MVRAPKFGKLAGYQIPQQGNQECSVDKVEDLISHHRWNRRLILNILNSQDAHRISRIPVSIADRMDSNFWRYSPGGEYTFNSGYKLQYNGRNVANSRKKSTAGTGMEDTSKQGTQIWRTLW